MGGLDIFFGDVVGGVGRDGQNFLSEGVVVVVRQRVLQDVAVGAGELLNGFKASRQTEGGVGLFVLEFGF